MRPLILLLVLVLGSCSGDPEAPAEIPTATVVPKGARRFGMHVTYGGGESYEDAFSVLVANRFDYVNLHQIWGGGSSGAAGALTTDANGTAFDFTNIDIANAYYPSRGMGLSLTVGTIDTNNKFVPSSFVATGFDQASVRTAFKSLLSNLLPRLSATELLSLQIGNEVDIFLGTDASAWAEYKTFFDDVSAHAKTLRAGLKVGVTTTLSGAIGTSQKALIQDLNAGADFVSVTYYPIEADFKMKEVSAIAADLAALVAVYPNKPIFIQEIGYASGSTYVASSPQKQLEAVRTFFTAWDTYATKIPMVSWLNLTEWSQAAVDGYGTQYGICPGANCLPFKEYLKTLGLRSYSNGAAKPALTEIISQTQARGW